MIMSTVLSGGILTSVTGLLMKSDIDLLFYSLTVISLLLLLDFAMII